MEKDSLKVGIVGSGFGERVTLPCLQAAEGMEVIAYTSRNPEKIKKSLKNYGIEHAFSLYQEMLELDEIQLVCITTPPFLHHEMAIQALQKGKHVLCEKPMSLDLNQAKEMTRFASASGTLSRIDHQLRFQPNLQRIKDLIEEGLLGQVEEIDLYYGTASRLNPDIPWNWWSDSTQGGGQLNAICSHYVDLFQWWHGTFKNVKAELKTLCPTRRDLDSGEMREVTSDEYAALRLEFENGAIGKMTTTSHDKDEPGLKATIKGERATLELMDFNHLVLVDGKHREDMSLPDTLLGQPNIGENSWRTSLVRYAHHMADGILHHKTVAGATFSDGVKTQAVLEAARISSREARCVDIQEIEQKPSEVQG